MTLEEMNSLQANLFQILIINENDYYFTRIYWISFVYISHNKKFRNAKAISNVKLYKNELSNRFKEIKKFF